MAVQTSGTKTEQLMAKRDTSSHAASRWRRSWPARPRRAPHRRGRQGVHRLRRRRRGAQPRPHARRGGGCPLFCLSSACIAPSPRPPATRSRTSASRPTSSSPVVSVEPFVPVARGRRGRVGGVGLVGRAGVSDLITDDALDLHVLRRRLAVDIDPGPDDLAQARAWLTHELHITQPGIVVAMGSDAVAFLGSLSSRCHRRSSSASARCARSPPRSTCWPCPTSTAR